MSCNPLLNANGGIELRYILPEAQPFGANQFKVHSACGNWAECEPGDLFVAIDDENGDGHEFVTEAVSRGASGVLCERMLPVKIPQFIVPDSRVAYGEVCHALAGNPSQRLATIGITGTAGKTVTAHLIHRILEESGATVGLTSTIESRYGDARSCCPSAGSAPAIANDLSKMAIGNCSHAVVEASSIQLAQRMHSGLQLDSAVITNSSPSNLHVHRNSDNYQTALAKILDSVKSSGFAVTNADDKNCMRLLDKAQVPSLTFGIHRSAEVTAKILERNSSFQTFLLSAGCESAVVRTSVIGKHHIYNCLAAAAVGLTLGIELDSIVKGLETAIVPGRLERVDFGQGFGLWIDSCINPNQLNGAIAALGQVCEGKFWCICSTDPKQSEHERKQLGAILERKAEHPIITQSDTCKIINYEPSHQVLDGFENPAVAHLIPNRLQAIEWALSQASPKDVVLICGAGEKPIGFIGDSSETAITDRDVCKAYLCDDSRKNSAGRNLTSKIFNIDDYR